MIKCGDNSSSSNDDDDNINSNNRAIMTVNSNKDRTRYTEYRIAINGELCRVWVDSSNRVERHVWYVPRRGWIISFCLRLFSSDPSFSLRCPPWSFGRGKNGIYPKALSLPFIFRGTLLWRERTAAAVGEFKKKLRYYYRNDGSPLRDSDSLKKFF